MRLFFNPGYQESPMANLKDLISEAFLGIDFLSPGKTIILNLKTTARISVDDLKQMEIVFEYYGEEMHFSVERIRPGLPYQLELVPVNPASADKFRASPVSVCLVEKVVFFRTGREVFRLSNVRYNPSCLS